MTEKRETGENMAKLDDVAISNGKASVTFKAQTITTIVENWYFTKKRHP